MILFMFLYLPQITALTLKKYVKIFLSRNVMHIIKVLYAVNI